MVSDFNDKERILEEDLFGGDSGEGGDLFGGGGNRTTDQQQPEFDLNDVGKVIIVSEISDIVDEYIRILEKLLDISPVFADLYDRLEQLQVYLYRILQNFNLFKDKLNVIIGYNIMYLVEATKLFLKEVTDKSDSINISKSEIKKLTNKLEFLRDKVDKQVKKEKKELKKKEKEKQQNQQDSNTQQQSQNNNSQNNSNNQSGNTNNNQSSSNNNSSSEDIFGTDNTQNTQQNNKSNEKDEVKKGKQKVEDELF